MIMKTMKKTYIVVGVLGLMALTSCNNDEFLEVPQYTIVSGDAMFENDANAKMGMTAIYDMMVPNNGEDGGQNTNGDWGFKPNLFTGCHPTMDTQATGWDKDWNVQGWTAETTELNAGWKHAYHALSRCNTFLEGLQSASAVSEPVKKTLEGEARACRAFFYTWLAQTFGRVPMLATGETYTTNPQKARAKDYAEMWDFIIDDLTHAAELLDWKPLDSQYGRATKGMALAYLGDAYMWKAYRCPEVKTECLNKAITAYRQILNEGPYHLNPCFAANWDPAGTWNPEAIWVEVLDEGSNQNGGQLRTAFMMLKWYTACVENGGWGSLFLSWEWYSCFEKGDKRRDGSCVTGAVKCWDIIEGVGDDGKPTYTRGSEIEDPYKVVDKTAPNYGYHPYLQEKVGVTGQTSYQYHCLGNGEPAPAIWSSKFWRTASAARRWGGWGYGQWCPAQIYWKRLPNVMLDLAECLFEINGENDAEAWGLIKQLRDRAFGKLEPTFDFSNYLNHYNEIARFYADPANEASDGAPDAGIKQFTSYPLPLVDDASSVVVPDAKQYYTELKAKKGFDSPVWKVAVNEERRKEFNCEWCLRPDMQKSGYMADHIEHNYPLNDHSKAYPDLINYPWTPRTFVYNEKKMDMPIPSDELLRNKLCDQNEAYLGGK